MAAAQPRSVAVTSLEPGDPGPAIATYLALALAEDGSTVALVDTDLGSPGIAGYLSIDGSPGITDVVNGTSAEMTAYRYDKRLLVLPAGTPGTVSRQAVSKAQLGELLQQLERSVNHVVIHVGPIIANADGADLCADADTFILVARKNRARLQQLRLTTEILRSAGADMAAVVLTSARLVLTAPAIQLARSTYPTRVSAKRRTSTVQSNAHDLTIAPDAVEFAVPHPPRREET